MNIFYLTASIISVQHELQVISKWKRGPRKAEIKLLKFKMTETAVNNMRNAVTDKVMVENTVSV